MDAALLCSLNGFMLSRRAGWLGRLLNHRSGWRFLGWGRRAGWLGDLPLYAKGNYVTYPQGYGGRLE